MEFIKELEKNFEDYLKFREYLTQKENSQVYFSFKDYLEHRNKYVSDIIEDYDIENEIEKEL